MKKKHNKSQVLKNNIFMLKKVWKHTPMYIIFVIIEGVIWGTQNYIDTLYLKILFDLLGNSAHIYKIFTAIGVMAGTYILFYIFHFWYWNYYNAKLKIDLKYAMHKELFSKAVSLDISYYDNSDFYSEFVYVMQESDKRASDLLEDIGKIINRIIASVAIISILFSINIYLGIVVLVMNCIAVAFNFRGRKYQFEHKQWGKYADKVDEYIKRVFYLKDYTKELRSSDVGENILKRYDKNAALRYEARKKFGKKYFVLYGASDIIRTFTYSGVLLWMTYLLLVKQTIRLGGFAASINALWRLTWFLTDMLERIANFGEHSLYIGKYKEFMESENKLLSGEDEVSSFESLSIKNLTFAYKENPVLKNITLEIKKGERVAFVGYNGAGKTTLTKLLMRLYDATDGEICYNGSNIKNLRLQEYRDHIGAVFQDYRIFAATIAENVIGGEFCEEDSECVKNALEMATFGEKLDTLDNGINTMITKEFDKNGAVLSGGETQKIAIARVFARSFELVIMDEPSSALDPVAEYELNHSIAQGARDKTVIFISHRLSTTKMADRIYMFDNGEIIEHGSHDELMTMNGKYAEMFNIQSEKYRKSPEALLRALP